MIDRFIEALNRKAGMSAVEIADIFWLAVQMQESESESVSSGEEGKDSDNTAGESEPITSPEPQFPSSNSEEKATKQGSKKQTADIYPRNRGQTSKTDLSFKTPNAPSLREPLTLARALKPLMRRVPAGTNLVLDEAATSQRIADEGLWLPVLRPTLEPWLDLELVVDESISMQIWRQTIGDLEKLLKNYGIFRDVRVWGLIADDGERVRIRRGIGGSAKNRYPRSPKELIDDSGRRLVLVASDCVSPLWRDGKVTATLELWANRVPTAIIQMLPQWLWKRTALGRATEVRLRALTPGVSNQNLIAKVVSSWEEWSEERRVKVPVFTLEADKAATWAQMLSGKGSVWTSGVAFELGATPVNEEDSLFNLDYSRLSAQQRVQAFRVTASPMARKLAGLLAAAPVITLPVVRLIREVLLKDSLQVNVAEVFLGGLLKPLSDIKVETNPDEVLYDFMDGVRELLVDSVPSGYVLDVVDEVSKYVAQKVGLSLESFAAVLRREKEVGDSRIAEEVGYFATVTGRVLRRLGGEYAKVAEELESKSIAKTINKVASDLFVLDLKRFYEACNPAGAINMKNPEDIRYYIDFATVRGDKVIKALKRVISRLSPNQPTCQLFTGHIGCGKSTELSRLQAELEEDGFHVVYFEATEDLDMADVDISDILLAIARQVSASLEESNIKLKPEGFKAFLQQTVNFLQTPIKFSREGEFAGVKVKASTEKSFEFSLPVDIGKITAQAKDSQKTRSQIRQFLELQTNQILKLIDKEIISVAQEKLQERGQKGLVVIVDNLDRIPYSITSDSNKPLPEYLFVDKGEQLRKINCHLIYTLPIKLIYSSELHKIEERLGGGISTQFLPMVQTKLRNGEDFYEGMELLRQMVLTRAFPELTPEERSGLITEVFDRVETLDRLCRISGGHPRNLLGMLYACLQQEDPPFSADTLESVIQDYSNRLLLNIDNREWELLFEVARTQKVKGEEEYQVLLASLFVFEYHDEQGVWFGLNPLLLETEKYRNWKAQNKW